MNGKDFCGLIEFLRTIRDEKAGLREVLSNELEKGNALTDYYEKTRAAAGIAASTANYYIRVLEDSNITIH